MSQLARSVPFAALNFHTLAWAATPAERLVTQTVLFVKSTYGVDEIMSMAVPVYVHMMPPPATLVLVQPPPPVVVTGVLLPFSA